MNKTEFHISKMDCPSEERIIRMRLEEHTPIRKLDFDLQARILTVFHDDNPSDVLDLLKPLNFGAVIKLTEIISSSVIKAEDKDPSSEAKVLKLLLAINGAMFVIEILAGVFADSMGLISDSLDMLADAGVYLVSLYAVGKALEMKKRSAKINGIFQLVLGSGVLIETLRRFYFGSDPEPTYMILVSLVALAANAYCLLLLSSHKEGGVHMKASYICSSTDVMANIGVIIAGVAVFLTKSPYPDLLIGLIVTAIVLRGAVTILRIAR